MAKPIAKPRPKPNNELTDKEWRLRLITKGLDEAKAMNDERYFAKHRRNRDYAPSLEWMASEGLPLLHESLIEVHATIRHIRKCIRALYQTRSRELRPYVMSMDLHIWNESKELYPFIATVRRLHRTLLRRAERLAQSQSKLTG